MECAALPVESIEIRSDLDIVLARQKAREMAGTVGFTGSELAVIATAISELARNIVSYAGKGIIRVSLERDHQRWGIVVVAEDQGPGIENIDLAMQDGYSTSNSLGLGLPGVKRLMDSFVIQSSRGKGTTVLIRKWTP